MTTFLEYYTMMSEGGNAVQNVIKIEQKYIPATLAKIEQEVLVPLGLKKSDYDLLGSALKKVEPSGDLDIGISITPLGVFFDSPRIDVIGEEFFDWIKKKLKLKDGADINWNKGLGVISIAYPIVGTNGRVQVDLMLTDSLDFTKFSYHVPDSLEKFYFGKPGVYRDIILQAISKMSTMNMEYNKETGEPEMMKYINYNLEKGLREVEYSYRSPKTGKLVGGRTKIGEIFQTKDVNKILEFLLGKGATEADANSFEDIWKRMQSPKFPHKKYIPEIVAEFMKKLTGVNERISYKSKGVFLPTPEVFKKYL